MMQYLKKKIEEKKTRGLSHFGLAIHIKAKEEL
jgi:hypothetical protein